jgi:predicted GNAT family acetyltransferase
MGDEAIDKLDETIEETFPASDAPANTAETGIHVGPLSEEGAVRDNPTAGRFEIAAAGDLALLRYIRRGNAIELVHTEVPVALRGRGLANALAAFALGTARAQGLAVIVACPFVREYLRKHPQ